MNVRHRIGKATRIITGRPSTKTPQTDDTQASNIIRANLEQILTKNNWSMRELAKAIGISHNSAQKWFCGERRPSVNNLRTIERTLGMPDGAMLIDTTRPDVAADEVADEPAKEPERAKLLTVPNGSTGFGWIDEICREAFEEASKHDEDTGITKQQDQRMAVANQHNPPLDD